MGGRPSSGVRIRSRFDFCFRSFRMTSKLISRMTLFQNSCIAPLPSVPRQIDTRSRSQFRSLFVIPRFFSFFTTLQFSKYLTLVAKLFFTYCWLRRKTDARFCLSRRVWTLKLEFLSLDGGIAFVVKLAIAMWLQEKKKHASQR